MRKQTDRALTGRFAIPLLLLALLTRCETEGGTLPLRFHENENTRGYHLYQAEAEGKLEQDGSVRYRAGWKNSLPAGEYRVTLLLEGSPGYSFRVYHRSTVEGIPCKPWDKRPGGGACRLYLNDIDGRNFEVEIRPPRGQSGEVYRLFVGYQSKVPIEFETEGETL